MRAYALGLAAALMLVPAVSQADGDAAPAGPAGSWAEAEGLGGEVRFGVSAAKPAMAMALTLGYAGRGFEVAAFAEFNPYLSLEVLDIRPGSLNVGALVEMRRRVNRKLVLRHGLRVGGSVLLMDSWGYPAGSPGLVLGLRLVGLEITLGVHTQLRVDLLDLVLVAHRLAPLPFPYPQHRLGIAFVHRF